MKNKIDFVKCMRCVFETAPLVQCITNFVTVNDCANIILAAGGSPSMAHDIREAAEAAAGAQALVCNMGAIEDTDAMILAGRQANGLGIPVVLDPVAVGGTQLRRDCGRRLLQEVKFTVIRGNASEIRYLAGQQTKASGVDAGLSDKITEENLRGAVTMTRELARNLGSVISVSGKLDIVSDGKMTAVFRNGCSTMARITGSGCMLTSLIGAYCGAMPLEGFPAACSAVAVMGICGELADIRRMKNGTGNSTFRNDLIDAVFSLTEQQLTERVNYEII